MKRNVVGHIYGRSSIKTTHLECEKLTDGRRTLTYGKSSHGLWPGELKISQSETKIAFGGHACYQIGTK
jgi:hypothetical protein